MWRFNVHGEVEASGVWSGNVKQGVIKANDLSCRVHGSVAIDNVVELVALRLKNFTKTIITAFLCIPADRIKQDT